MQNPSHLETMDELSSLTETKTPFLQNGFLSFPDQIDLKCSLDEVESVLFSSKDISSREGEDFLKNVFRPNDYSESSMVTSSSLGMPLSHPSLSAVDSGVFLHSPSSRPPFHLKILPSSAFASFSTLKEHHHSPFLNSSSPSSTFTSLPEISSLTQTESKEFIKSSSTGNKKRRQGLKRGSYNCGRCGQPKKGHQCSVPPSETFLYVEEYVNDENSPNTPSLMKSKPIRSTRACTLTSTPTTSQFVSSPISNGIKRSKVISNSASPSIVDLFERSVFNDNLTLSNEISSPMVHTDNHSSYSTPRKRVIRTL